ncbi:MAG: S-layer homology domain-containing protein, partial [Clostridiales bacterium]
NGDATVEYGDNKTYTITAYGNYNISDVKVDNVSCGKISSYTFQNIKADHNIEAIFTYKNSGGSHDVIVNTYKLEFNTNGGSKLNSVSIEAGNIIDLGKYETKLQGSDFAGWYADKELTKPISSLSLTENTTVYAKWTVDKGDSPFKDINPEDWFSKYIEYVYENELMEGIAEGQFAPSLTTTRAMITTVFWRIEGKPETTATNSFPDLHADWYKVAVNWAAEHDIVLGYENGNFGPMDNITREQLASIIWRYAKYKGYDVTATADLAKFADAGTISEYAIPAMHWVIGEGLMEGNGDQLAPRDNATRAQLAAVLMRFMENVAK